MLMTSGMVYMMNMRIITKQKLSSQRTESILRSTAGKILKQEKMKKR